MSNKVVLDTNIILDDPQTVLNEGVVLPYVVLAELDKLKRDQDLRFAAQHAIRNIKIAYKKKTLEIVDIPLNQNTNDEKIVQAAKDNNAKLWTRDVGASVIALSQGIELYDENEKDEIYDISYIGYSEHKIPNELYYSLINKNNVLQIPEIEELTDIRAVTNEYLYVTPDDGSLNYKILRKITESYIYVSDSKKLFSSLANVSDSASKYGLDFEFLHYEQAMAFDAVFNTDTPLAVIEGKIGSGKTLLSTVAALARTAGTNANKSYNKILVTRPNRPISKEYELGFLPGDENAKMKSWLSGFTSNLEFLYEKNLRDVEDKKAESVFSEYFKPVAIESIQGASFHNCILIIDEAQLLDTLTLKQIMSRLADSSKCVLLFDPNQTYGANRGREGYKKLLPRCKGNPLISYVNLQHIQRSPLTRLVNDIFEGI